MFIDSHAHLTSPSLYGEVDEILARAKEAGVDKIINICTDQETLENGLILSQKYPWVYNTASTTPHDVDTEGEALFDLMQTHARSGDLVAVGETGLDYYYMHSSKENQIHFLRRYLQLATECKLPVVIHCRDAFSDLFRILDEENYQGPGVLHCFTGTLEEAKEVISRGWFLSLSGIVTFKKSLELKQVAQMVPLSQLLIETDSPYLAPNSRRGKQNEPAYITETAQHIADLREIPILELAQATSENTKQFFSL